jgi:hypothetical protein
MGRIAGLLFFQGEADTPDPTLYPRLSPKPTEWAGRFEAIVAGFRTDLAQPDLPVVFAQIGPMNHPPEVVIHWKTVQEQQRSVHLPYCAMITTDDLTLQDEDHFTTESYEIIGRRFAEAYWKLMHP